MEYMEKQVDACVAKISSYTNERTSFYMQIAGLLVLQFVVDILCGYASQLSVAADVSIRVLFMIVQLFMALCFENGLNYFQLRILLIVYLNSAIKACSVDASPLETLIVLSISISPLFDHFDEEME